MTKKTPKTILGNVKAKKKSKWNLFFIFLAVIDALFILQLLHALFIYPNIAIGKNSVVFVALFGWYSILFFATIHFISVLIYIFYRRPRDLRLAVCTSVLIFSVCLLFKYDLIGTVEGVIEKATIQNESHITKKVAHKLLQNCRIIDLVITQKYGAKLTFYTIPPEESRIKTVYIAEKDIQEINDAIMAKGDSCGREVRIYNDGSLDTI